MGGVAGIYNDKREAQILCIGAQISKERAAKRNLCKYGLVTKKLVKCAGLSYLKAFVGLYNNINSRKLKV